VRALFVADPAASFTIPFVKTWDVIVIGGGIIGLSLAISLRKQGLHILLVERGEPGREASYAAAGMLAPAGAETPSRLSDFAQRSARLYPEFVHELEDESGIRVDLREQGTILLCSEDKFPDGAEPLSREALHRLEPEVDPDCIGQDGMTAVFLPERSVDPRSLVAAATKAAHHRQVDIASGTEVRKVVVSGSSAVGVETQRTSYSAAAVVNCAGAWAGTIPPHNFPVHPVKGQMLAVVAVPALHHVVRSERVYLVPRSDGRVVIGSTLEKDGYHKNVDVNTIRRLLEAAIQLFPAIEKSRKHEVWAGLRPGTPDNLPILGETSTRGYFVAAGHYRDGILLAPATAEVMTNAALGRTPETDITNFSPSRFL
jgi:glycine oxidase